MLLWLGTNLQANEVARAMMRQLILEKSGDELKTDIIRRLMLSPFFELREIIQESNKKIDATEFAFYAFSILLLDQDLRHIYSILQNDYPVGKPIEHTVENIISALIAPSSSTRP